MIQNWILKFTYLHPELIEEELIKLIPGIKFEKFGDTIFKISASRSQIDHFYKYSALIRIILNSPRIFDISALSIIPLNSDNLMPLFDDMDLFFVPKGSSVAVRFFQIGEKKIKISSQYIEKKIANALLLKQNGFIINLKNPDYVYQAFTIDNIVISGWVLSKKNFSDIQIRAPVNSPYFGGGALKVHLCRTLVNLLHPIDPYILDPFSGHGGILREIADMGSTAFGLEINRKLSLECKENNYFHGYQDLVFLITCDALFLPIRKNSINQAISDPPYGIQTTLMGRNRDELLYKWLNNQDRMIIVISTPSDMLNKTPNGWEILLERSDYVHKTLTRKIRLIRKGANNE